MSEDPVRNATKIEPAKKSGGMGKWLIGAAAAAVLAGGGYFAWKSMDASSPDQMQTAYNEDYAAEPASSAAEMEANQEALAEIAAEDEAAAPRAAAPARTASAASAPEASIGVSSASENSEDDEAIVVPAPRRPVWERTPSARRLSALYPERALERGREGQVQLACVVEERGMLDCDRVSETPGGFGPAAVRVARTFRHAETLPNGQSAIGTPVNLRVVFRIEEERGRAQRFAMR